MHLNSTEDLAHGRQDQIAFMGHFDTTCFHPSFGFTSYGDCVGGKLRQGNVQSAEGIFDLLDSIIQRHRPRISSPTVRGR